MAGDHPSRGPLPRHDQYDDSQYPPVPGEEHERPRLIPLPRSTMASGAVTLPSIHDRAEMYVPPNRPWDSRAYGYGPSPSPSHGYPPPPGGGPSTPSSYSPSGSTTGPPPPSAMISHQPYSLPPVPQHAHDARGAYSDPRSHDYYPGQASGSYNGPNAPYEFYRQERNMPGPYASEYARTAVNSPPVMAHGQSAPRQRTSIACKYCRRRKIRCSGYANSPGGKCTNCIKMNQECIFQPVSSTSSTAFVPVSALPNGIQPGMQLFGAYGQPLQGTPNYGPGQNYQGNTQHYEQSIPSPTGSNQSYWEENRQHENGRRRHMADEDHPVRLPPPNSFPDDNSQRRSPSSNNQAHLQPYGSSQPQPIPRPGFDSRASPPRGSPSGAAAGSGSGSSVMNLENIMSSNSPGNDIDQNMLGRLNRRGR